MLNRFLLIFTILLSSSQINAQNWYRQVMRNEMAISFPVEPENKLIDDKGKEAYISQFDGCGYMAGISPGVMEDYESYLKMSDSEQVAKTLSTLADVANGKISAKNQHLISMTSFRYANGVGLDVEYATSKMSDPDSKKRFCTLFLVKNTLYMFDCWYLDDKDHTVEKERFFKSIQFR